jgi:F-type H+-transporting ATPase subunit delta
LRDETVSKNYAETLFELGRKKNAIAEYGEALDVIARMLDEDARFRLFLETPRIEDEARKAVVKKALGGNVPQNVLNFVLVTIDKRRQRLLREISRQYNQLVDAHLNREHVEVTLGRKADEATEKMIATKLSTMLGKEAIPHFRVKPEIIGGLVVRTHSTIYDGSVRRRLDDMRRKLLHAQL